MGCPFLMNARPRSGTTTTSAASATSSESRPIPISEIVDRIVKEQLGLANVDTTSWILVLEKNLIMNWKILVGMKPELLHRLQLPLALEVRRDQIHRFHYIIVSP